jgi:hypothetical protein
VLPSLLLAALTLGAAVLQLHFSLIGETRDPDNFHKKYTAASAQN